MNIMLNVNLWFVVSLCLIWLVIGLLLGVGLGVSRSGGRPRY